MTEARIWYPRDVNQATLSGGFQNEIVLSYEFFKETIGHPIPTDMEAAKALSSSPAAFTLRVRKASSRCRMKRSQPPGGEMGRVELRIPHLSRHETQR